DDPAPAARRVPAAAGDPPGARLAGLEGSPPPPRRACRARQRDRPGRALRASRDRPAAGSRPRRVRAARAAVRRERRGHRRRLRAADRRGGGGAAPAQVRDRGGKPGRPARGAAAEAPLAEPGGAPGRARGSPRARRARAGALAAPLLAGAQAPRGGDLMAVDLAAKIRDVPDFPKPGIVFKDIMPLLADPEALKEAVERIAEWAEPKQPDLVLGAEARGYITGGALACRLGCGFIAARKPGKLPWRTVAAKYALEYGFDSLEVHADAIVAGQRVLIHDDVLATGGTAKATVELVEQLRGEVVGLPFIIELEFLRGREKLQGHEVFSLLKY